MSLSVVLVESRQSWQPIYDRHLRYLPKDHALHLVTSINSIREYNELLTTKSFWGILPNENVLIIQHDSEILRHGIEDFYEWDYIGASWNFAPYVGNGGFSLRHKSAMIKVINNYHYNGLDNEDIYFANGCKNLGLNIAPVEVANKFSCETQFHLGTLGTHAIDKYLTKEQCNLIRKQYERN